MLAGLLFKNIMSDDVLNNSQRKQRRQSAIQLRRLSMPSPAALETQILATAEDTVQASRSCYRMIFIVAAVRIGATLLDERIWSKLFDPDEPNLGWVDYVDIFDSSTWLVIGLCMWHLTTLHERNKKIEKDVVQKQDDNIYFFTLTYWAWGIIALNLALVSLSIASALPEACVEGALCSRLSGKESILTMIVGTIIVVGYSIIHTYCTKAAIAQDERDNQRINQDQRDSKNKPHFKRTVMVARRAYCSILLRALEQIYFMHSRN